MFVGEIDFMKKYFYALSVLLAISCGYYLYHGMHNGFDIKIDFMKNIEKTKGSIPVKEYLSDDMITYQYEKIPGEDDGKIFGHIKDIEKRGELVVIGRRDDHHALFQIKTGKNKYIGKDIEVAKIIASHLGVRLRFRMIYKDYDDIVKAIENGEGDIGIAELSYTKKRARKVVYSNPYITSKKMLLINRVLKLKRDKPDIYNLLNDKDSIIGTSKGSSYEAFIKELFPKSTIISDDDLENNIIPKLQDEKIIALMRDEVRVKMLLKKHPDLLVKLLPIVLEGEHDPIGVILNYKSLELLSFVNKCLEIEGCQEDVDSLIKKYGEHIK